MSTTSSGRAMPFWFALATLLGTVTFLGFPVAAATGPALTIADASVTEGNFGTKTLSFSVTVSSPHPRIEFSYATSNGSATAPADYTAKSGRLSIGQYAYRTTVAIPIVGDTKAEPNETFTVAINNATAGTIADGIATGTILNNDGSVPSTTTGAATTTTTTVPSTTTAATTTTATTTTTTTSPPATATTAAPQTGKLVIWMDEATSFIGEPSFGLVTGPGINCGSGNADCDEDVPHGQTVTLQISAGQNSYIAYVDGCTGPYSACQKTIVGGYLNPVSVGTCPYTTEGCAQSGWN